jgi:hypothetical protein
MLLLGRRRGDLWWSVGREDSSQHSAGGPETIWTNLEHAELPIPDQGFPVCSFLLAHVLDGLIHIVIDLEDTAEACGVENLLHLSAHRGEFDHSPDGFG